MEAVKQTVSFKLNIQYRYFQRYDAGLPEFKTFEFDVFEDMMEFAYAERKRRAFKDRATSATYQMVMTETGWERHRLQQENPGNLEFLMADHSDAINGKEFKVY